MTKKRFYALLNKAGQRINGDPLKAQQNRLAGPYRRVDLQVPPDYARKPVFRKLAGDENKAGFYDTLDEARGALRTLTNALAPDSQTQSGIFAMRDIQWTITRDLEPIERGSLIQVWLEMEAAHV